MAAVQFSFNWTTDVTTKLIGHLLEKVSNSFLGGLALAKLIPINPWSSFHSSILVPFTWIQIANFKLWFQVTFTFQTYWIKLGTFSFLSGQIWKHIKGKLVHIKGKHSASPFLVSFDDILSNLWQSTLNLKLSGFIWLFPFHFCFWPFLLSFFSF